MDIIFSSMTAFNCIYRYTTLQHTCPQLEKCHLVVNQNVKCPMTLEILDPHDECFVINVCLILMIKREREKSKKEKRIWKYEIKPLGINARWSHNDFSTIRFLNSFSTFSWILAHLEWAHFECFYFQFCLNFYIRISAIELSLPVLLNFPLRSFPIFHLNAT